MKDYTPVGSGLLVSPIVQCGFLDCRAKLSKKLWEDDEAKTKVPGDAKGKKEGGCNSIKKEQTEKAIKNKEEIKNARQATIRKKLAFISF